MYGDDDTHITGQITFSQIAEAIRHKKYGRDMREAIAQGFEQFIGILRRVSDLESEYSDLLDDYNAVIKRLGNAETDIKTLNQRCENIEKTHQQDIQAITNQHKKDIGTVQKQLDRLNQAVFGYGEYEVNYETPHHDSSVTEINTDSNPMLKN